MLVALTIVAAAVLIVAAVVTTLSETSPQTNEADLLPLVREPLAPVPLAGRIQPPPAVTFAPLVNEWASLPVASSVPVPAQPDGNGKRLRYYPRELPHGEEAMNTSPDPTSVSTRRVSRWLALVLFTIVWGVIPWLISLLVPRYGWAAGRPGPWNLLALILVVAGIAGSLWTLFLHFAGSRHGLEWELTKSYLLKSGPYALSRHPMYLFELTLILGWALFYGSVAVFIAALLWWALFTFRQVPLEERVMEARFGAEYAEYKRRVPRWFRFR